MHLWLDGIPWVQGAGPGRSCSCQVLSCVGLAQSVDRVHVVVDRRGRWQERSLVLASVDDGLFCLDGRQSYLYTYVENRNDEGSLDRQLDLETYAAVVSIGFSNPPQGKMEDWSIQSKCWQDQD